MGRRAKKRRQSHGSAWHWQQTNCWYYTLPGSKKRVALYGEEGERIRGKENRLAAEEALAREKLANASGQSTGNQSWLVARVCSEYLQYCRRSVAAGTVTLGHERSAIGWLNDLCSFCGALPVAELKKGHIQEWVESHSTWKTPTTVRSVLAVVLAAFNRAEQMFDVPNPLVGLKKPAGQPRLHSITPDDEQKLLGSCEECFRNFLFVAIRTGLRPL